MFCAVRVSDLFALVTSIYTLRTNPISLLEHFIIYYLFFRFWANLPLWLVFFLLGVVWGWGVQQPRSQFKPLGGGVGYWWEILTNSQY